MGILSRFWQPEKKSTPPRFSGAAGRRLVIGNWKSHKTSDEARRWLDIFAREYVACPDLDVVLAPTLLSLESVARYLEELRLDRVYLAAQDISPFPRGGYTGAVAADMLKGLATYVIVGHSERRRYFHETPTDVTNKVTEVIDAGLRPVVCVDRPYAVAQLCSLADLETDHTIVAYCPADALSFRIPEPIAGIVDVAGEIRSVFPDRAIVYGGSLTPENVGEYLGLADLAGVFVGSASLDAKTFLAVCRQAADIACRR